MSKEDITITANKVTTFGNSDCTLDVYLEDVEMEELANILIDNTTPDELFSYLNMNTLIDHLEMNGYSVMEGDK